MKRELPRAIPVAPGNLTGRVELLALYVAAESVHLEVQKRTLSAVMIRPVARHAYLLGRLAGGIAAFGLFPLAAVAFSAAVNLKNGTPVDPGMPWAFAGALVSTLTWTAILLPLAAITSFPACLGLLVTAQVAGWIVGMVPAQASQGVPYLKDAFYYLSPVELPAKLSLQASAGGCQPGLRCRFVHRLRSGIRAARFAAALKLTTGLFAHACSHKMLRSSPPTNRAAALVMYYAPPRLITSGEGIECKGGFELTTPKVFIVIQHSLKKAPIRCFLPKLSMIRGAPPILNSPLLKPPTLKALLH